MNRESYDMVIIGAGVIGTALADEAVKFFPYHSIAILEKNPASGLEMSSKNSGVLHSGFHQLQNSFKAKFANSGHIFASDFAKENDVPLLECGMLIAIPSSKIFHPMLALDESVSLWNLFKHRKSSDKLNFKVLTSVGIKKLESNICAAIGIFIPSVSVIDSHRFVQALATCAEKSGVRFFYENEVKDIHFEKTNIFITTTKAEIQTKMVINAAGLYADYIANLALKEKRYQQFPWRGEYYEVINPDKKNLVTRLVYPAVSSSYPGKGIHFGPRPNGRLFLGPNAKKVPSKTFYNEERTPKKEFLDIAKKFLPCLEPEDIEWSYSGIRPKLSNVIKEDDFHIGIDSIKPLLVNLMGIESPGISSAMALAKYVCEQIKLLTT